MSNSKVDRFLVPTEVVSNEDLNRGTEDDGLGPADEDEDEPGLPDADTHGIETSNDLTTL